MNKLVNADRSNVKVTFFQRRHRIGHDFSLESIFADIRCRLAKKIDSDVKISKFHNNGPLTKIYNIFEAALRQSGNINHITGELHFLDLFMKKETVILTVLDCGMVAKKKGIARYLVKWLYLKLPVRSAKIVTAISEATKQEILEYTKCEPSKISVIPVAVELIYQPFPKAFNSTRPDILQVGTPYNKNIGRLIESLRGLDCRLTIVGKLSSEHVDALNSNKIDYRNFYNLAADEMLERYKECDILAFVSTFEGFGMPIVEANSVERVVITSNISSMPEVAGDAACLVDPYDVNDIRNGILRLINDEAYRNELIDNGRKNKLRFDPEKISNSYLDLYRRLDHELARK